MALPEFSMRQLMEAGVHFGHQTHRWNPKMGKYIFGSRKGIHIIDLTKTVPLLHQALIAVSDTVARGGRVLFVGTKRQAQEPIAQNAHRCAQYYVNSRWLGGMLTNWQTVSKSISRLREVEEILANDAVGYTKKEKLNLTREEANLQRNLGGIKDMGGLPELLFICDVNKESLAVAEARKLGIQVVGILDSNSNPDGIDHPVPGNDDASRAISLYCDLVCQAALDGIQRSQSQVGIDIGEMADGPTGEGGKGRSRRRSAEKSKSVENSDSETPVKEEADAAEQPSAEVASGMAEAAASEGEAAMTESETSA